VSGDAGTLGPGGIAGWSGSRGGRQRALLATALGVAATGALPPLFLLPLAIVAFTGLQWLLDGAGRPRRAFLDGWWFGVGHFATGLYWLAHAMLTDPLRFGWMIPFAVLGLAAVLGLFTGAAAAAAWRLGGRGPARILALAVAWTAAEMLRGVVLTGFPWNLTGTIWAVWPAMMQPAAAVGLQGLSLLTVALAAMPATLADGGGRARRLLPTGAALLVLAGLAGGGALRLGQAEEGVVPGVRLRLVQPDIAQALRWERALAEQHLELGLALSALPAERPPTHVIWSETAIPFLLDRRWDALTGLARAVPPGGLLIAGAIRSGPDRDFWNSLIAVDGEGRVRGTYDKAHLVPFGEYVPLRRWLGFLPMPASIDMEAGPGPRSLVLPGLPKASPLICYEAIFPGAVVDPADRSGLLLNISNDAWFGISSGPHQHLAAARFRAVEEGLPLVRATNNGISAVVDAEGRVRARLGLGSRGVLDADLPSARPPTPFASHGHWATLLLVVAVSTIAIGLHFLWQRR